MIWLKKVITYGTFDMLHQGHLNILKRAKAMGDYFIVGVTSDDFDSRRGKINVQQSMMERVEGVKETGLADQIIIEEYEGQKIDDINRFGVDILDEIDVLSNDTLDVKAIKEKYHIPADKIVIMCGTNARQQHQHMIMLEQLLVVIKTYYN